MYVASGRANSLTDAPLHVTRSRRRAAGRTEQRVEDSLE